MSEMLNDLLKDGGFIGVVVACMIGLALVYYFVNKGLKITAPVLSPCQFCGGREIKKVDLGQYVRSELEYWPSDGKYRLYMEYDKLRGLICIVSKESLIKLRDFLIETFPLEGTEHGKQKG